MSRKKGECSLSDNYGRSAGKGKADEVIYWRTPMSRQVHPGWITWNDSVSGTKMRDFSIRGFEPLWKYGRINGKAWEREVDRRSELGEEVSYAERIWGPILRHLDGPAEFPLEQIIGLRWYRPEDCPIPNVHFPQLDGQKVKEYRCPQCQNRPPFIDVNGVGGVTDLANHLQIMHEWKRESLMAYGDRVGIDFNKIDAVDQPIQEYVVGTPEDESGNSGAPSSCRCGWLVPPDSKNPQQSLIMHQNIHCKLRKKEPATA